MSYGKRSRGEFVNKEDEPNSRKSVKESDSTPSSCVLSHLLHQLVQGKTNLVGESRHVLGEDELSSLKVIIEVQYCAERRHKDASRYRKTHRNVKVYFYVFV